MKSFAECHLNRDVKEWPRGRLRADHSSTFTKDVWGVYQRRQLRHGFEPIEVSVSQLVTMPGVQGPSVASEPFSG